MLSSLHSLIYITNLASILFRVIIDNLTSAVERFMFAVKVGI